MFTLLTSEGKGFWPPLFGLQGSSSSLLRGLFLESSAVSLLACFITQQLRLVWLAAFSGVPWIWQGLSKIASNLVGPSWLPLEGIFRDPDFGLQNLAFTAVSSVLSLLFRRLCMLRRGLPLLSRTSEVPECGVVPLRANQLSSPAQKRVISVVRAAMDLGFS